MRLNSKKVIGVICLIVVILLLSITFIYILNNKRTKEKNKIGLDLYQKVHNLYYFGSSIQLDMDDSKDGYYKILNYDEEIKDVISKNYLEEAHQFLNIKKYDEDYYMVKVGKGVSNYYGTTLKIEKVTPNKMTYTAKIKLCDPKYMVTYGDGCEKDGYYYVEKPFVIVKEDDNWKVSEYTSIFQLSDREIK